MEDVFESASITKHKAGIVNNIIDKISAAVGILYADSNYKMKRESLKKICNEILQREDLDEFAKAVMISNLNQNLKHYNNQKNIIENAIKNIDTSTDINQIDDEWLLFFFDKAKNISSEEMQKLWGKILSEEFNQPNSIPKSLIHKISIISKNHAKTFSKLSDFLIVSDTEAFIFIYTHLYTDEYMRNGISYSELIELESDGLLKYESSGINAPLEKDTKFKIGNHTITVKAQEKFNLGQVSLTDDGIALFNCLNQGAVADTISTTTAQITLNVARELWRENIVEDIIDEN